MTYTGRRNTKNIFSATPRHKTSSVKHLELQEIGVYTIFQLGRTSKYLLDI